VSKLAKSRLGRGLSSLISVSDLPIEAEIVSPPLILSEHADVPKDSSSADNRSASPASIPVETIVPNPHQPRRQMNEASIAELAASIKSTGVIQPVIVRQVPDGYELIAGERRWRAAKLAGLSEIPALIRNVDSFTQAQMALVENIQREDLNPMDRAESYKALISQLGLTQAELANRLGEDRSTIANFVRLLDLAEPVRQQIRAGTISTGHAKILAGVQDILEQERLANLVISQELSVRNLERMMLDGKAEPQHAHAPTALSAHLVDLERTIAAQIGMKVQIRSSTRKGRGRFVIHYATLDQFDELLNKLGVRVE